MAGSQSLFLKVQVIHWPRFAQWVLPLELKYGIRQGLVQGSLKYADSRNEWMGHKTAISLSRCKETSPGLWDKRCIYLQKSINTNGTLNSTPNRVYEICEIFTSWKKISGWDGRNQYSHLGYHLRHFNPAHKACLMGDFLMLVLEIHNIWRQNNFVAKNSTLLVL